MAKYQQDEEWNIHHGGRRMQENEKKIMGCIDEYLSVKDFEKLAANIPKLKSPKLQHLFISVAIKYVLKKEAHVRKREMIGLLLHRLLELDASKIISEKEFKVGLNNFLKHAHVMEMDSPLYWAYLGEIFGAMAAEGARNLTFLKESIQEVEENSAKFIAEIMKAGVKYTNEQHMSGIWQKSGFRWAMFLPSGSNVQEFLNKNNLTFTEKPPQTPFKEEHGIGNFQKDLLQKDNLDKKAALNCTEGGEKDSGPQNSYPQLGLGADGIPLLSSQDDVQVLEDLGTARNSKENNVASLGPCYKESASPPAGEFPREEGGIAKETPAVDEDTGIAEGGTDENNVASLGPCYKESASPPAGEFPREEGGIAKETPAVDEHTGIAEGGTDENNVASLGPCYKESASPPAGEFPREEGGIAKETQAVDEDTGIAEGGTDENNVASLGPCYKESASPPAGEFPREEGGIAKETQAVDEDTGIAEGGTDEKKRKKGDFVEEEDKKENVEEEELTKKRKGEAGEEEESQERRKEESLPESYEWTHVEHKGPFFPPYDRLPTKVKLRYEEKLIILNEEAEEAAVLYAKVSNQWKTDKMFNTNFFQGWTETMTSENQAAITDLKKCDFSLIEKHLQEQEKLKKERPKEEKKTRRKQYVKMENLHRVCTVDGKEVTIDNFVMKGARLLRKEDGSLKIGMLKRRIQPNQVTINCSRDSKFPEPPPGQEWKEIVHNNKVLWLWHWTDNIDRSVKSATINSSYKQKECKADKLPDLEKLPPMTPEFLNKIQELCDFVIAGSFIAEPEIQQRNLIVEELEQFIQDQKGGSVTTKLALFGSSVNGFGSPESDLDISCSICSVDSTGQSIDATKEIIEGLEEILKKHDALDNVHSIPGAKVPIVKFVHRQSQLEVDLSLNNFLGQCNSRLCEAYAEIDPRVPQLVCMVKKFAKICKIADASQGSLSSYAYVLLTVYFLQQTTPPVIPVLQENDVWDGYGRNKLSVAELWLGFLRFYTETFDFDQYVVCIRQHRELTRSEKDWTRKGFAIEDPFELDHNLGGAMSPKMANYITLIFRNARKRFGIPQSLPRDSFICFLHCHFLTNGQLPPKRKACNDCLKIGHLAKDCPNKRRKRKERANATASLSSKRKKKPVSPPSSDKNYPVHPGSLIDEIDAYSGLSADREEVDVENASSVDHEETPACRSKKKQKKLWQ